MTGYTYREIGDLTFPQMVNILNRGEKPIPRITKPSDIRHAIRRIREEEAKSNG
jgi:hypothetical protein